MSHDVEVGSRRSAHALREVLREEDRLRQAGALLAGAMAQPSPAEPPVDAGAGVDEASRTEQAASPDGDRQAGRRDQVRNDLIDGA